MNTENKKETIEQKQEAENKHILTLEKPIRFEGETVEKIDLSCLEDATGADLTSAKRMMNMNGTSMDVVPERTFEFAACLAATVTKKPLDLFNSLKLKDAMNFSLMVRGFLY